MTNIEQFKTLILDPTLKAAELYAPESSDQVLGTGIAESQLMYFKQVGGGPALGFMQMEPVTFNDLFYRYLEREGKGHLKQKVYDVMVVEHPSTPLTSPINQLMTNLPFAILMARIRYLVVPHPIPKTAQGQAAYWKEFYNTPGGGGTVEKYLEGWNRYVGE